MVEAVNIKEKFDKISSYWSPAIVEELNDYHVKLVKVKGEFVWHKHDDTDELFFVLEGELYVVKKGIEHKPVAVAECKVMLLEPAGTVNTGNTTSDLTKKNLEKI